MTISALSAWTNVVALHPDVESGNLTEAVFAIDLGAIAANDKNVPVVYRDPEEFFRATYLTSDMKKLLEEVMGSLSGATTYNRVLKMRTPFGGGKSHTLATLYHAAKSRDKLNIMPEAKDFPNPGKVSVAVFDGEKFDALNGKTLEDGRTIMTMWGWVAWQLGEDKYKLVEKHDRDRVSPGGDVIKALLEGTPTLILLDEVLKYMERAAAVPVHESTLQRQALDFFQNLTIEVAGSSHAAMVYSLQWSAREAMGNIALLKEIDKLASRVDQIREPVTGDEVLCVIQRRLLGKVPPAQVASDVANAYCSAVTSMRKAYAETATEKKQADEEGIILRDRLRTAYPFHPTLIDVMKERWASIDDFQRTRGALRFLASCLHSLKKDGGARAILGPPEIPLGNVNVRIKMLKELGVQNDYDPVITADISGPNARARRIDERLARETPELDEVKPATRIATAILTYSFGGLRRDGEKESEMLPPGVTESELLQACVGPDLDNITATAVLSELKNACLYLHYDGVRYCFKKDPNVTKLIEDAEMEVAKDHEAVKRAIKEMIDRKVAGKKDVRVWPVRTQDLDDKEPLFVTGYMPLEFSERKREDQENEAKEMLSKHKEKPRHYRNGVGLAIPEKKQIEPLRRAVRYLLAIEKVEEKKNQFRLTKEQMDQMKERKKTEEAAAEAAMRQLYSSVWLPCVEKGELGIEKVEVGGRPLAATGIHERIMELLINAGAPKLFGKLEHKKIIERLRLGESPEGEDLARVGLKAADIVDNFFSVIESPRITDAQVLKKAIAKGVVDGAFGYTSGRLPELDESGKYKVSRDKVVYRGKLSEDEVDLDSGFIMMPSAIPEPPAPVAVGGGEGVPVKKSDEGEKPAPDVVDEGDEGVTGIDVPTAIRLNMKLSRDEVFKAFPAIANLAEKSDGGKINIEIKGSCESGYDPYWFRNAVEEPLDEADIRVEKEMY